MGRHKERPLLVVQNNLVTRLTAPIAIAARERNIIVHDVSSGEMTDIPATPGNGLWSPVLVIGSVLFVHRWARADATLSRWVFWDDDRYDAALWAEVIGDRFLNAHGYPTTISAFVSSDSRAMHIRPRSGSKMVGERKASESTAGQRSVSGLVASPGELAALEIDGETPIWVSSPRHIYAEVRVWMIGGQAAASSTYRIGGQHVHDREHRLVHEAREVARQLHGLWQPDRHYVADLALTEQGWRLVEYNPIHSAGWYDAEPGDVLDAYLAAETAS
jgi:hypothetical protein